MERKIEKEMECVRVLRTRTGYWVLGTRTGNIVVYLKSALGQKWEQREGEPKSVFWTFCFVRTRTGYWVRVLEKREKKERKTSGTHA